LWDFDLPVIESANKSCDFPSSSEALPGLRVLMTGAECGFEGEASDAAEQLRSGLFSSIVLTAEAAICTICVASSMISWMLLGSLISPLPTRSTPGCIIYSVKTSPVIGSMLCSIRIDGFGFRVKGLDISPVVGSMLCSLRIEDWWSRVEGW
jgi:hypothetical protein